MAHRLYRQTREGFIAHQIAYDTAMVSLDLAILYLREGRLADVQHLAEEMLPIFQAQSVDRETIAALRLFQEAAYRQELTAEKVRELAASLRRLATDQLSQPADLPPSRPAG